MEMDGAAAAETSEALVDYGSAVQVKWRALSLNNSGCH